MNQFGRYFWVLLLGVSCNATAVPVVTKWAVRVESGFVVTASTAGGPVAGMAPGLTGSDPSPEPDLAGAPATISWGSGNQVSSLSVGGPTGGHHETVIFTHGGLVDTVQIELKNRRSQGPALVYAGLLDGVWSDAVAPGFYQRGVPGTGENHLPLFWNIFYLDTPDSGPCQLPGFPSCPDIAVVEPVGMPYLAEYDAFVGKLDFFGHSYLSFLQIEGLTLLDDALCKLFGSTGGCLGIIVPENTDTTLQVRVGISVPEPYTLACLLMAMMVGGFSHRRWE